MLHFILLLAQLSTTFSCTTVHVTTEDDNLVVGRTMELGGSYIDSLWGAVVHPRGDSNLSHGFVSFSAVEGDTDVDVVIVDGMNEYGFTVSVQTHQQAQYQDLELKDLSKPHIFIPSVPKHLLERCRTIQEARSYLEAVVVFGNNVPRSDRVHWSVVDEFGDTLVVEYINGELVMSENIAGVLTNDPHYTWHLQNLNNYAAIGTNWADASSWSLDISGKKELATQDELPSGISHGVNLLGLPGGYTPANRFVRAFVLKQHTLQINPPQNIMDAMKVVNGLINSVHIILGMIPSDNGNPLNKMESTEWSIMKLPMQRKLFYRSYDNFVWRSIDLQGIDFVAGKPQRFFMLSDEDTDLKVEDYTDRLH